MKAGLLFLPALYASWLAMMAVHELGHVLHGWVSGATVAAVRVPLLGFSLTEFSVNPRPHFVAWGGAVWGGVLPLAAWAGCGAMRCRGRRVLQWFAGFCLVSNGAYLVAGAVLRAGDARDVIRYGSPVAVVVGAGVVALAAGLWAWHRLGEAMRGETQKPPAQAPGAG